MLRRLRSSDKVEGSRDSTGRGFLWRSKKGQRGERNSVQNQRQPKPPQKPKERRKEEYKPPQHRVGSNKFDQGLSRIWDDFMRYRPYYSFLVEFLNSQVSMRVDEKTSTTSAIAVAERVQLHRILLCNESSCVAEDAAFGEPSRGHLNPPDDESIVKTRNLIELENVQVFTAKRDDFENQAAYFVDCTYGSQLEGDASQPSAIWPAWIPIELLLSQSKHRARGIFDDLDGERRAAAAKAEAEVDVKAGLESDIESDDGSDSDGRSFASHSLMSDGQSQIPRFYQGKRGSGKYSKAWWLEDLSKYKCLMDRNNGLVVYDKANPHRIQGDTSDRIGYAAAGDASADAAHVAASAASEGMSGAGVPPSATSSGVGPGAEKGRPAVAGLFGGSIRKQSMSESVGEDDSDTDSIDDTEAVGSNQGLSHRANHFAVFLPELNLACTTEQYTAIYETVTELIVFIDPEKAAYMDHLNTILLGMDMGDLRGLLAVIRATQQALRERLPIIQDWYVIQRSNAVLFRDASRAMVSRDHWPLLALDIMHQKSRAASLLTLDRHRQALELQLRTAMDLFGAAQKQLEQQRRRVDDEQKARAAQMAAASTQNQDPAAAARSTPSSRRPTFSSVAGASIYGRGMGAKASHAAAADEPLQSAATDHRRMSLVSASSRSTGSQVAEETQNTIARTIHIYISKATWHMLENDGQPLCDMTLRWATLKAVTTSDQATHLLSEVHLLYIVNQQPNPMFTDLVGPYVRPKHSKPDFCVEKMIRVRWSELAPVGGISIVERFEVDLFPLRLQFSHDIAQKLVNYLYPPQEGGINGSGGGDGTSASNQYSVRSATASRSRRPAFPSTASNTLSPSMSATTTAISGGGVTVSNDSQIVQLQPPPKGNSGSGVSLFASKLRRNVGEQPPKGLEGTVSTRGLPAASTPGAAQQLARMSQSPQLSSGLFAAMSGRSSTPLSLFTESNSMINISQSGENRDQVDQMKKRASSNKTFLNVKIGGSTLCISYQGKKANNITDLRDFEFHAPTLELRNQVESYYELLMQVKKEYMSVVVHHTGALVKEKFRQLHSRKAWNKASFGPDWEARKLLIDMDRRVDEDM
ncbi:Protein SABRE, partial [Coemansia thaxteri]